MHRFSCSLWQSPARRIRRRWEQAATAPAAALTGELRRMLVRHDFTSVVDTGSYWPITSALRRRIDAGEVTGPRILTAGEILFPKGGAPPAARFGRLRGMASSAAPASLAAALAKAGAGRSGRIAPGEIADLVLLDADPVAGVAAFAQVARVIRGGRIIYTGAMISSRSRRAPTTALRGIVRSNVASRPPCFLASPSR